MPPYIELSFVSLTSITSSMLMALSIPARVSAA
jgi:hypothetical protein